MSVRQTSASVKRLVVTAIFMAMNVVLSSFGIPVPGGHLYLCDVVICLASILLNPLEAVFAAGVGSFLGDMLFYPQGYTKPARVQGAFVSDQEVNDVVDFLKEHSGQEGYDEEIVQKIKNASSSSSDPSGGSGNAGSAPGGKDELFVEAAKAIIDKNKASIGMLQRAFKIGFNRAARIMDQLCEAGVVGEEEGTKPRKILMTMEQFENYLEEN